MHQTTWMVKLVSSRNLLQDEMKYRVNTVTQTRTNQQMTYCDCLYRLLFHKAHHGREVREYPMMDNSNNLSPVLVVVSPWLRFV